MLHIVGKTYGIPKELLKKVALATFSFLRIKEIEIELKFVSLSEISRLNDVYRQKVGPTDVLSFNLEEKPLLGQVFICYTFVKEQAKKVGKTKEDEVALLLVHGILHIAGYDHANLTEEVIMQKAEKQILGKVDIKR